MKKIVSFLISFTLMFMVGFAVSEIKYQAVNSNAVIAVNGKRLQFENPIVTIEGQTYVPLREVAEKANMQVDWYEEANVISVMDNIQATRPEVVFERVFDFPLTDNTNILKYDLKNSGHGEYEFYTKCYFDKNEYSYYERNLSGTNFDFFKENNITHYSEIERSYLNDAYKLCDIFSWWDLPEPENLSLIYFSFNSGVDVKTVPIWHFVSEAEDGGYYLYSYHGWKLVG